MSHSPAPVRLERLERPAGQGVQEPEAFRKHLLEAAHARELLLLDAIQLANEMAEEDGPVTEEELEALRQAWPPA